MGIPKFFRFISERWPLISQLIDENQIPEFDNLYLDMNSILHTCTHSNDDTLSRMTDDQMYAAIFSYIEHLFEIIKPNKVFYMAIDGVAPRAKMNQQRARRFRTAFEAEENLKKAIENGEEIPKEDPFDSNCITPGTEFMSKLTDNLKYFIHKKITEDSNWANIQIVLSGHEVPGEGEHKIMDYIRTIRSEKTYDPNVRHCIYGLDADLIMLGLSSHDPHFALLREEVTFGPSRGKPKDLHEQNFYLLHLSLLREYMALEFEDLESQLSFDYDFDRVLDDFILIMYVIGNDFLPNLPDLFINKGAFPLLIATFKQTLKQSDGYINEEGKINLKRLNIWIHYLSEFELENFEKQDVDVEWFNKKLDDISITGEKKRKRIGKLLILKDQKKLVGFIKPWFMEINAKPVAELIELENQGKLPTLKLPKDDVQQNLDFIKEFALEVGIIIIHSKSEDTYTAKLDVDGMSPYETDEEYEERLNETRRIIKKYQSANLIETEELLKSSKDIYDTKFLDWKDKYYKDKLHFSIYDREKIVELTEHYVEGLQWVLYYYYQGVPSWNWYYKYHYSPRISDISVGLEELIKNGKELTYEKSTPFKPFEQLMAVLPARSRKLMPLVYRPLMTEEHSPIINFYPHEVDIDMNGKTASWEAVVLLDFVDEKKLIEALKPIEAKLTPEETKRNSFGDAILFVHNPQIDYVYPSPLPGFFHDLEHDQCLEEKFVLPKVDKYRIGFIEGAKTGKELLAGFPTLHNVNFHSELLLNEVKVFQYPSRSESMILTVDNIWEDLTVHQFAQQFVNKLVYTKWPFLRESKVVKVCDSENKYESHRNLKGIKKVFSSALTSEEIKQFRGDASNLKFIYEKTKGVKLGDIEGLVYVQPVNGLVRNPKGAYVKTFAKELEAYPLQLVVKEITNKDQRFATRAPLPIDEEFPLNSQVVFLGDMAYGTPATVVGYNDDKLSIKISKIQSIAEPNIGKKRWSIENREIKYYPSFEVSKTLRLNPLLLSRITSQYMILDGNGSRTNIGLELKFEGKRQKVLGYTKKSPNGKFWEFSPLAIDLINRYKSKFPKLFANLSQLGGKDMPRVGEVSSAEELKEVRSWLKEVKRDLIAVSLESESLTKFSFEAIEQFMINYVNTPIPTVNRDIKGVPKDAILNPGDSYQLLSDQKFELGDRVIYVQDFGKAPILSKGTVVSISTIGSKTSLGLIFDYPLLSGNTMNGKLQTSRGLTLDSSLVLNITNRQFVYHSRASQNRKPLSQEEKQARLEHFQKQKVESKQRQEQEAKAKSAKTKEINAKKSNELLTLLKGGAKKQQQEPAEVGNASAEDNGSAAPISNTDAIKQIYGTIYTQVMSEGQIPQGPPAFYGAPILAPGQFGVPPMYYPAPPPGQFAPIPGQFAPGQPPQQFQQPPPQPQYLPGNRLLCHHGHAFRGRGGHAGRGGRGNSRGGRGSSRGGHRGRGKSSSPPATAASST
ncbi:Kem1 5 [Scheffersomyces xylosifermentans]|uniref:Kem1 5 n=1 Tax=Scheffersomyces xylosifermentans TaxID=1304137 RepID=UPI00315DD49D